MLDKSLLHFDSFLRSKINRASPAANIDNPLPLSDAERKKSIAMMRINHSGEVCAQALYQGQALVARSNMQYNILMQAAAEETDHLYWCKQRLQELNGRPSLLNPIWYLGSFGIGALAGFAGDKISLGFLAETEYQVAKHIEKHLARMPSNDRKSRAVLQQMHSDELKHATTAQQAGGVNLPVPMQVAMQVTAKILTVTAAKI